MGEIRTLFALIREKEVRAVKVLTAAAMREADRRTIEELGLPGIVLMENAAMRVVEAVLSLPRRPQVVIVAGPGNNGGDGLAAARLLRQAGRQVSLWTTAPPEKYRGDAAVNYEYLRHSGFPVKHILDYEALEELQADLNSADLLIDALFGTGLGRPVEGIPAAVIGALNRAPAPVLAVDLPSGIEADSGRIMGAAVQAQWTVSLAFPKPGLLQHPGAGLAGEVLVGAIGVPSALAGETKAKVATAKQISKLLKPRLQDSHKGSGGRVLLIAGSTGMSGAAALASAAALRGGAGLVYLAAPASLCPALEARLSEVITLPLPEKAAGVIAPQAAELLLVKARRCGALAVGPGLAPQEETAALVEQLLQRASAPLVLDAGALAALALFPENKREALLRGAGQPVVLTPHPGEMAVLTGLDAAQIQQDRPAAASRFAGRWGCCLVLKGAGTVSAAPGGELCFNPTGGPTLATAGTGDLLTGLLASLVAQGLPPFEAAAAAAYIHGLAGDLLPRERGYKAGDVLERFPEAFQRLRREAEAPASAGPFLRRLRPL